MLLLMHFKSILDHWKTKNNKYEIQILWESGEITWEPMHVIKECDPVTLSKYAHESNMIDKRGWKWCKHFSRNPQQFIRMAKVLQK